MKALKLVAIILVLIAALIAAFGFTLPSSVRIERKIVINAPQDLVFGYANGFANFNAWSPWFDKDPDAKYSYSGPQEGVGASMSWVSEKDEVGAGAQKIVESKPLSYIKTELKFGEDVAYAVFNFEPSGDGVNVVWAFESDMGYNPMMRIMGNFMFESFIGPDYEKGLAKLKKVAEEQAAKMKAETQEGV